MQVTVQDISSIKKVLQIEIPEADVTRELEDTYKELKKTAKIKGFRPGKAPRSVLERIYKKEVNKDVTTKLIQTSLSEAITEKNFRIVGYPKIDSEEIIEGQPYKYDVTIELSPEIADIDFKGLKLKKQKSTFKESEVNLQIKMLQNNLKQFKDLEAPRPIEEGDAVSIDFEVFENGVPFEGDEKTEGFMLKIGDARLTKEFDKAMIGMNADDEKEITVTFNDDFYYRKFTGKTLTFKVKVKEIKDVVLPEIDDEFAKQFGPFETLDALKDQIRNNLKEGYTRRIEADLQEQAYQQLIEKTEFDLPESLINAELDAIIADAERSYAQHNVKMEDVGESKEKLAEKYKGLAEKQVRRYLLVNKIIEQEKITLTDEELQNGLSDMSKNLGHSPEQLKYYFSENEEKLDSFKHALLEKKAMNLIIDNGDIEEIESKIDAPADEASAETTE